MSVEVIDQVAERIAEHASQNRIPRMVLILHGGEPLLAGVERLSYLVTTIRQKLPPATVPDFRIQTNGLLLSTRMLEFLQQENIRVGVSLDGDQVANDRHRRYAHGGGSYTGVVRAIERLRSERFRSLYSGLLCTIDIRNDPVSVYESLLGFEPPRVDFLLPHGNWTSLPPHRNADPTDTSYADWLIPIFHRWYSAPRQETDVRLFHSVMSLLLGGPSTTEALGLDPVDLITIETDGSIEQADSLKTTEDGAAATGLHIDTHSFDKAALHQGIRARQSGLAGLAAACRACPVVEVCGGGLYAHRYSASNGFDNPTVYCADQLKLINHIRRVISGDLARLGTP